MTSTPLLCLPIAFALIYLPKIPLSMAMAREPEGYDNAHPRDQQAKLTGWGRRAAAAHANAFESFPPFAAGVLAVTVTGASPHWAAILSVAYVVSRALYAGAYIAGVSTVRSLIWTIGFASSLGLLVLPIVA
ncbi:MAG: MAPEG family protein [Labilithrix sp.]|nr:MAPEG family protein [Labilithrix sp.]